MHFNRYVFSLFLESNQGQECVQLWQQFLDPASWNKLDFKKLEGYISSSSYRDSVLTGEFIQIVSDELEHVKPSGENTNNDITWQDYYVALSDYSSAEIKQIAKEDWQIVMDRFFEQPKTERKHVIGAIVDFYSTIHTFLNPYFFFPYFFVSEFGLVENLFREFGIDLPELPPRKDYEARLNYYWQLCEVLYDFRQQYEMTPAEFNSFVYGFAGSFIKEKLEANENPLRIWITGGGKEEYQSISEENNTIDIWSSNREAQRADLQLVYFRAPYSGIGAVCKCLSDGYFDPFWVYDSAVITDQVQLFPLITIQELRKNPVWKHNSLVKRDMQGVKDQQVTVEEYEELRNILEKRGEDASVLPKLEAADVELGEKIRDEREVEEKLLEPLLQKLGFKETDWTRQLAVRMGRGERNYPDYALLTKTKKYEEEAKFLWEAKFRIRNQKELKEAFVQNKSYALRLKSQALGLISVDGVWISRATDNFDWEKVQEFTWSDLNKDSETLMKLRQVFQK